MRELTCVDIIKNKVDTISQYHILDYLKKNLDINEFRVYLVDNDNIKVVDKTDDSLNFSYDNRKVIYKEETKEIEHEMGL